MALGLTILAFLLYTICSSLADVTSCSVFQFLYFQVDQVLAFYYHLKICSASLKLPETLGPETFSDPTDNSQVSEPFAYKIIH